MRRTFYAIGLALVLVGGAMLIVRHSKTISPAEAVAHGTAQMAPVPLNQPQP